MEVFLLNFDPGPSFPRLCRFLPACRHPILTFDLVTVLKLSTSYLFLRSKISYFPSKSALLLISIVKSPVVFQVSSSSQASLQKMKTSGDNRRKSLAQLFPSILAFVCRYEGCGQALSSSANLRRHVESVHLCKKKFICSACNKRFTAKQNLKHHLYILHRIHYQEVAPEKEETGVLRLTDLLDRAPGVLDSPRRQEICPAPVHYMLPQLGQQQAAGPLPWVAESTLD